MSDAMLERTVRLSQRMMDNSPIGSKAWSESGAKFTAAFNEQLRRKGHPPVGKYDALEAKCDSLSKEIIELIKRQFLECSHSIPIDGESLNGFGQVSGYIFGFCTTACLYHGIQSSEQNDRLNEIGQRVFRGVYYDDILAAGIFFATARTTQVENPALYIGYDLGRADAIQRFEQGKEPSALAKLLSSEQ